MIIWLTYAANMDISEFAKKGAAARWKGKTKKERKEFGKMLAEARKKAREAKEKKANHLPDNN